MVAAALGPVNVAESANVGATVFGVVCVCLSLAFSSIGRAQADPINVFVSVLPQQYFAERVGGERVRVSVMVGPGQSPATYEPTPRQMAQLSQAAIYWRMGSPFEDVWMKRIMAANPRMQVIDVRDGIAVRQMEDLETVLASDADLERHEHGDHSGREAYRHHAGQRDPHIWLSPPRVMRVTAHFKQALVALDPKHHAEYEANYTRFTQELEQLHRDIKTLLATVTARRFMVFHPAWGYFADTYELRQIPIEIEGKAPGPRTLAELIALAKSEGIRVIFVQQQFSHRDAETVARAIDGRVVKVDPLALDYSANLRQIARTFAEAMQ